MQNNPQTAPEDQLFLPDFCHVQMVLAVAVMGELLAFLLVLAPTGQDGGQGDGVWEQLALTSLFIQWVGLSSAGLLTLVLGEAAYSLMMWGMMSGDPGLRQALQQHTPWSDTSALPPELTTAWHLEFQLRNLGISAIVSAVALRYFYVQHQWKHNLESEARARIQALQSRIRPHFLFNSMNTIASLARSQPALAEQVTVDLAELFRVSLKDASIPVTLASEMDLCRQYLRIEAQRLGKRMTVRWAVDTLPGEALLPALTLQPLLENAVYHGIEPALDGGLITVSGTCKGKEISLDVSNPLASPGANRHRSGNHLAQHNVEQRLQAFFHRRARMEVHDDENEYRICLRFPVQKGPL